MEDQFLTTFQWFAEVVRILAYDWGYYYYSDEDYSWLYWRSAYERSLTPQQAVETDVQMRIW